MQCLEVPRECHSRLTSQSEQSYKLTQLIKIARRAAHRVCVPLTGFTASRTVFIEFNRLCAHTMYTGDYSSPVHIRIMQG